MEQNTKKNDKKFRKRLLKMLKSGDFDFIRGNSTYIINGIAQYSKLCKKVTKQQIKFCSITDLKQNMIIVRKNGGSI